MLISTSGFIETDTYSLAIAEELPNDAADSIECTGASANPPFISMEPSLCKDMMSQSRY